MPTKITVTYPNETHASEHFTWKELDPRGLAGPAAKKNLVRWCQVIGEPVRRHYGRPVHITSGYRSTAVQAVLWKEAVKKYGSEAKAREHVAPPGSSEHENGTACDFWIAGVAPAAIASYLERLPGVGGIGIYPTWVHGDVRPLGADGRIDRW